MKELEKIFKDSFDGFEPEVNNSVWQKLEQNLASPPAADPSSAASAGKAAITAGKGIWAWVAGIVATGVIATAVIFSQNEAVKENAPVATQPTIEQQATENNNINKVVPSQETATYSTPQVSEEKKDIETKNNINNDNTSVSKPEEHPTVTATVPVHNADQITSENNTSKPSTQPAPVSVRENPAVANDPVVSPKAESKPVVETNIILKNTIGFAPFNLTAMLNDDVSRGSWNFGDGNGAVDNRVSHTYTTPGKYELTCTVNGKELTRTIDVVGTIATAFTPNGDGMNDEYYLDIPSLEEVRMLIFDRNGRKVFEITSPDQRWDGKKVNGELLPDGNYFYDIFARSNGQAITQRGSIKISR